MGYQLRAVGAALREVRLRRGLKQRALAERCGISDTMLSLIENGKRLPSPKRLDSLCENLGVLLTINVTVL